MGSGEQIDDLIELDTIRSLDWNDAIPDIQLGMRDHTITTYNPRKVCKDNSTRPDAYVSDIYSQETYRRTYQSNFYPVEHEDFWRDVPNNLTFYPPNMKNNGIENMILPQDVADVECPGIIEKIVITSIQAMYKFFFFFSKCCNILMFLLTIFLL
ncbi:hypothetical protein M9H77_31803 [Catharanthus roseus]|uniref:Uncharacterized protein n=1 Tax=Catharanthus roseus TaxID=4058 RepID=A0ACC0A4Z8_CATRO|nr:hypothetical protein M9H77_31803 [Catharanthus roseus]